MGTKTRGQALIEEIIAYIERYVVLPAEPAGQSLVLALWVVHTWFFECFPATPYLTITAPVKQAGKTVCLEVLGLICRSSHLMATLRPLALVRLMEAYEGKCTLLLDEAEKLSNSAIGDLRSIFTTGYTNGGRHLISGKGKEFVWMRTWAPKAFALIGDVMDVCRDRSIVVHLRRADPKVDFRANRQMAEAEARMIQAGILAGIKTPTLVAPMFLQGREREIWTALFSIAASMELDKPTMLLLERAASDLVGLKSEKLRSYSSVEDEAEAATSMIGELAMRDLRAVLKDGEANITSVEAVRRMKELGQSPWRTFKGSGLTDVQLAALVKPFGVGTKSIWIGKGRKGRTSAKGYSADNIKASVK